MTTASPACASRFYQRWLGADPARSDQVAHLAQLSLACLDFGAVLDPALPLPRAMRRLRNLLVAALIRRDLEGLADLDEVVTAITRFADFAIARHVEALTSELVAAHGMPVGHESGRPQQLMVLAMGKQGGFELNV